MAMSTDETLNRIYYNLENPASYSSVEKLYQAGKQQLKNLQRGDVVKWLEGQAVYTLHKPVRKRFNRRKIVSKGIGDIWQADLVIMQNLSRWNNNYAYIMTVIDIFTRKANMRPLKRKTGAEVAKALESVFEAEGYAPRCLHVDQGTEFYNKVVRDLLQKRKVKLYSVFGDMKAAHIERFHRTMRKKMYTYFEKVGTKRWIDILPKLVTSYNNTVHSITKFRPIDIKLEHEDKLWEKLYGDQFPARAKFKFNVGDYVRLSRVKGTFGRGYTANWTAEYFIITHRRATNPPMYKVKDLQGETIRGSFYEKELVKIQPNITGYDTPIEILKRRKGGKEVYIRFVGWPSQFDKWVSKAESQKYPRSKK